MKSIGTDKLSDAVMDDHEMWENHDTVIALPIMVIDQILMHIDYIFVAVAIVKAILPSYKQHSLMVMDV